MLRRTLFLLLVALCPFSLAWADDWPQWRGPERTGISKEKGLLQSWPAGGPKLLWTFRDAGIGYSGMSVVGDRLYSMGGDGKKDYVFAVDLKTQKKLWSAEVALFYAGGGCDGPRSTPTIDGGFLYTIGGRGNLVCVETATGRKIWSQDLTIGTEWKEGTKPYGYCESPLVDGDVVVVTPGGDEGAIAAFDKRTGKRKWRSTDFTPLHSGTLSSMVATAVGGVRQYVQSDGGYLVGVRAADGKLLWTIPHCGSTNTPICHNDLICIYSDVLGCKLFQLMVIGDQFKAKKIYTNREMGNFHSGVILTDGYLYGRSERGQGGWMCQDFKTGKTVWRHDPQLGQGSIIYADGNLYCYHYEKGDVLLIKATPKGYQERGKFRIPEETKIPRQCSHIWTHAAVANGKLYLRDLDLIFCYDLRKQP